MPKITNDWLNAIGTEFEKPYYLELREFLKDEYRTKRIFPAADDIFNAFHFTPLSKVKAVILGQDPYINKGEAIGACFAVPAGIRIPPSLQNIYKELHDDLGCRAPNHGFIKKWADEGVLLLNAVLTVQAGASNSHQGKGWEQYTDAVIEAVDELDRPVVFFLWGKNAKAKRPMLTNPQHLVLEAPHPSPFSADRGFFGCRHFSKANEFLIANGVTPIDWQIEDI